MEKVGRNDPCPCGSGKKFKQCCLLKKGGSGVKRKLTAKWLNPKQSISQEEKDEINLMDRAFGHVTGNAGSFQPITPKDSLEGKVKKGEPKKID